MESHVVAKCCVPGLCLRVRVTNESVKLLGSVMRAGGMLLGNSTSEGRRRCTWN
jgi:hypothetical protein